jgi:hypothetical protein
MGSCLPILVADYRSSCSAFFFHLLSAINWLALLSHSWPSAAWCFCFLSTKLSEFATGLVTLQYRAKVRTSNNSIVVSEILIFCSLQLISQLQMDSRWHSTSHRLNSPLDLAWWCYLSACTGCPTRYRTRHFFNNSNINEDIATKFEQECVRCVKNVMTS